MGKASYPSAEMQSVYSTALENWAKEQWRIGMDGERESDNSAAPADRVKNLKIWLDLIKVLDLEIYFLTLNLTIYMLL